MLEVARRLTGMTVQSLKVSALAKGKTISPQPKRTLAYLLLLLSVLFWAGNWVVGRAIRADLPPIALSFWRGAVALICVLPWAWQPLRTQRHLLRQHWRVLCLLGILGSACNTAMGYIGLSMTTATNAVLLGSTTPIMIIALSWALLGKRLQALEWLGVLISLVGVLVIVAHGDPQALLDLRLNRGDLWVLASLLSWALYTVLLIRRPASLHPFSCVRQVVQNRLAMISADFEFADGLRRAL